MKVKEQIEAPQAAGMNLPMALSPEPNTKLGLMLRLAQGPDRATPLNAAWTLEDGSTAQRFTCIGSTTEFIRRACAPEERCHLRHWVWWEVECGYPQA